MSKITTNIEEVVESLKNGIVVAIPTETVYGLAANAEDNDAIKQVFEIKKRPLNHPLILHVANDWDISRWVSFIPDYARTLIQNFWPGPLTLVMKTYPHQNPLITGGQDTIAIRCPSHSTTQALLKQLNFPIVAPSANPFGKVSPTTAKHVKDSFKEESLLILDGGRCEIGIESTIVNATNSEGYQILREGMISEADLSRVCPVLVQKSKNTIRAPGQLDRHYQPEKKLFYFSSLEELALIDQKNFSKIYVIAFDQLPKNTFIHFSLLPKSVKETAFELYFQLRKADASRAKLIAIQLPPPNNKAWEAIIERIQKAGLPFDRLSINSIL